MIDFYLRATNRLNTVFENIPQKKYPDKLTYEYIYDHLCETHNPYNRDYQILFKKLNMIDSNRVPTEYYRQYFSDAENRKKILAGRIRYAYNDIFSKYPNAHKLDKNKIKEIISIRSDENINDYKLNKMTTTFLALCALVENELDQKTQLIKSNNTVDIADIERLSENNNIDLDLEVNISFPNTKDTEVHKAIFEAYKSVFDTPDKKEND